MTQVGGKRSKAPTEMENRPSRLKEAGRTQGERQEEFRVDWTGRSESGPAGTSIR